MAGPSTGSEMNPQLDLVGLVREIALRTLRRWGLWLIILAAVSLLISAAVARTFSTRSYRAVGELLYTPIPVPEEHKELYDPPELKTLSGLVTSQENINQLRKAFDLPVPVRVFEKIIEVEVPAESQTLVISMDWPDPVDAAAMVNRLMANFQQQVQQIRRQKQKSYIGDFENLLAQAKRRWAATDRKQRDFFDENGILNFESDEIQTHQTMRDLEIAQNKTLRKEQNVLVQLDKMKEHIKNLKAQSVQQSQEDDKFEAAQETVADNRRRQDRLRELIQEERGRMQVKAQLEVKRNELDRAKKLYERRTVSRYEVERIEAEMKVLEAKIALNKSIEDWEKELKRIDKMVVPKGATKKTGSPIIQQTLFKKLELELELIGIKRELIDLKAERDKMEKRSKHLRNISLQGQSLIKEAQMADLDRQRIATQLDVLRQLYEVTTSEFAVVAPAQADHDPVGSNGKIILAGLFLALMSVGGFLALGHQTWVVLGDRSQWVSRRWNLLRLANVPAVEPIDTPQNDHPDAPVIHEESDADRLQKRGQELRRLSLKIRQLVPKRGCFIVFSGMDRVDQPMEFLADLAGYFSRRDERVLIMQAAGLPEVYSTPGADLGSTQHLGDENVLQQGTPSPGPESSDHIFDAPVEIGSSIKLPSVLPPGHEKKSSLFLNENAPAKQSLTLTGLGDYLTYQCENMDEFIHATTIPGVDLLPWGRELPPEDGWATHRMRDLLENLRERYSLVLFAGPLATQAIDLEMLAAVADGIAFVKDTRGTATGAVDETLSALRVLHAPILGMVISS